MGEPGTLKIGKRMGFTWIVLPDAINMDTYGPIEKEVGRVLIEKNIQVVVDLSNTNNLFSSGLGLIIRVRKKVYELNGSICLVNVSQKIRSVFETVHLDKVLPLYATDVEFEISQEQFRKCFSAEKYEFVFVARIENGIYRINCSGHMTVEQNLTAFRDFAWDVAVGCSIFDLTGLDMIDSTGVAMLIKLVKDIHDRGGTNFAYGANQSVTEVVNLLGMDEYVKLFSDERSALQSIRKP
jgi:anti-anti-sigma factor